MKTLPIILLTFLPFLLNGQQNSVVWRTNYYSVTGATLGELRQSTRQSRPWKEQFNMDGFTVWQVNWQFTMASSSTGCRCASFATQTSITVTLPQWKPPTNAPPTLVEAWGRYVAALGQHEAGHAQLALSAAVEMQRRIAEVGQRPDCEQLKGEINAFGNRIVEDYRKRDKEYDERTRHGATQGAVLPGRPRRER